MQQSLTLASLGQQVYYEMYPGLIIPCTVTNVDDVYTLSHETAEHYGLDPKNSLWVYSRQDQPTTYSATHVPGGQVPLDAGVLVGAKHANQFLWVDEIIGHGVWLNDSHDGVWSTLELAMRHAGPPLARRDLHNPHKKIQTVRNIRTQALRRQQAKVGGTPTCRLVTERKPIWRVSKRKLQRIANGLGLALHGDYGFWEICDCRRYEG